MWKYVSRRLKDTVERGASYFEARNVSDSSSLHNKIVNNARPLCVYAGRRKCWSSFFGDGKNKTHNKKWYYEQLCNPWIGALTWSSALIVGWYASQLLCFSSRRYNRYRDEAAQKPKFTTKIHPLVPLRYVINQPVVAQVVNVNNTPEKRQINGIAPRVTFVSNESGSSNTDSADSAISEGSGNNSDKFSDVLSAIENKLGMTAIEHGDANGGISLLKSAAQRNHAPALYNLGLCYENGIGTAADEKLAQQYYRAAAVQEHPMAMYNLAIFYGQGRGGLPRDSHTASRLLRMAASLGQKDAISLLSSVEPEKAPVQPVGKQFTSTSYLDTPTGLFLQAIGAVNPNDAHLRKEELIY